MKSLRITLASSYHCFKKQAQNAGRVKLRGLYIQKESRCQRKSVKSCIRRKALFSHGTSGREAIAASQSGSALASISARNSALALIGRAKYHQFSSAFQPSSSATSSSHKQIFAGSVRLRIFSSARLSRGLIAASC